MGACEVQEDWIDNVGVVVKSVEHEPHLQGIGSAVPGGVKPITYEGDRECGSWWSQTNYL